MKRYLSVILGLCISICALFGIAWLFHPKSDYPKMHKFYDNPEEYDVWFMGSSHAIMSSLPEELYHEYGIRSYNLAEYGQGFPMDYWLVKNFLRLAKPKLIVLDLAYIGNSEKYSESNINCVRRMVTSLPISRTKIEMIDDLFEGDRREEMLFPFSADHYNWESLEKNHLYLEESWEYGSDQNVFRGKGREGYNLVTASTIPPPVSMERANTKDTLNKKYFRRILELCRDNDTDVLVVKCPLQADNGTLKQYADGFRIAREYGVPYVNGFEAVGLINGNTDMWDTKHLNSSGARKWTHYLGEYISQNYPEIMNSPIDDKDKKKWDENYEKYLEWLDTELPLQNSLYSYLLLCSHPQYQVEIYVLKNSRLFEDEIAVSLLKNIGDFPDLDKAVENHTAYAGTASDYTDNRISENVKQTSGDIQIVVYSAEGTMVDRACFKTGVSDGSKYEKVDQDQKTE